MGGPRRMLALTTHEYEGLRELVQLVADDADGNIDHRLVRRAVNMLRLTADVPLTDVPVGLTISEARAVVAIKTGSGFVATESTSKRDATERAIAKIDEALQGRQKSRGGRYGS